MRKPILFFLLVCSMLWAAGSFNMVSTKHLDIMFDDGLERVAYKLHRKADEIFERFMLEFKSAPRTRPKVYLLRSDLSNGYANPLNNVIVIYVSDMDPYQFTARYEDWVIFCFVHELAHIFLANQFSPYIDPLSVFGHAVAAAVQSILTPLYLHEGVAIEYESREGEGRANDALFELYRKNALASEIGLKFASSINTVRFTPGGASYTLGYTLLKSLEEKREGVVNELIQSFSRDPLATFYRHLRRFASFDEIRSWLSAEIEVEGQRLTDLSLIPSKLNLELWRVYYAFRGYDAPGAIYFYDIFEGKNHRLVEVAGIVSFAVNSRRELAIVRRTVKDGRYVNKLYLWKGSLRETNIEHVIDVAWFGDERLALIVQQNDVRKIVLLQVRTSSIQELQIPQEIVPLQIAASKDCIAFTGKKAKSIDLYMLRNGSLTRLTKDGGAKLSPIFVGDVLYFVAETNGELCAHKLDLSMNRVYEIGVKNCVAAVEWEGKIFSIKPLPSGHALFSEPARTTLRGSIVSETLITVGSKLDEMTLAPKRVYDSMKLRFLLPFPYVDPAENDLGIGAYIGFWDDLNDNIAAFAFLKTMRSDWANMTFSSSNGLAMSFEAANEFLAFDVTVSDSNYSALRNDVLFSTIGLVVQQDGLTPRFALGYAYGTVGGVVHLHRFADFSFTIRLLPNMYFELSKAFAFKQLLFEVRGGFGPSGLDFSTSAVLPAIKTNLGSFDGFLGLDSFAVSLGMVQGHNEEYWARVDFNAHVSYQVPLKPYMKIGLKNDRFFIQIGFDDVISSFLRVKQGHAIISTAR
ncbi:hypothetical protein [Pseudothermotoga sp.]